MCDFVPFPIGLHLIHLHSKKEVVVERDGGGETVYVSFFGTGKSLSIPRIALTLIPSVASADCEKLNVKAVKVKSPKKSTVTSFDSDVKDFLMEITYDNHKSVVKILFNEDIDRDYNKKDWGLLKMRIRNRIRKMLQDKIVKSDDLWNLLGKIK